MKLKIFAYSLSLFFLIAVCVVVLNVQTQGLQSEAYLNQVPHGERFEYYKDILVDPDKKADHVKALKKAFYPAVRSNQLSVVEDLAFELSKAEDKSVRAQALATLGDVLLEKGDAEAAKETYKKAVQADPRMQRFYALRLWDMDQKGDSIKASIFAMAEDGITLEDCVGENSFLRRARLIDEIPENMFVSVNSPEGALLEFARDLKAENVNEVKLESNLLRLIDDRAVKTALRMQAKLANYENNNALSEWDALYEDEAMRSRALDLATGLSAELQYGNRWFQSVRVAEHALQQQKAKGKNVEREDELLYRITLGYSWLKDLEKCIPAAEEVVEKYFPQSEYAQRALTTLCLSKLLPEKKYDLAERMLLTVHDCAASNAAYFVSIHGLAKVKFLKHQFYESLDYVNEALDEITKHTRWQYSSYQHTFECIKIGLVDGIERIERAKERHALRELNAQNRKGGQ